MKNFFRSFLLITGSLLTALLVFSFVISSSESSRFFSDEYLEGLFPEAEAGFGMDNMDIFQNYQSWPSSSSLNPDDTVAQSLRLLYSGSAGMSSLIDINGDGLTDILYHILPNPQKYAVLINQGNLNFDLAYKCAIHTTNGVPTYYGDCADA